jgi:hypothetical protein
MVFGRLDLAWNRPAVMYSMVKMGRGWKYHLGVKSTRRTSEEQGGTRSFPELPARLIRGTSVAPHYCRGLAASHTQYMGEGVL